MFVLICLPCLSLNGFFISDRDGSFSCLTCLCPRSSAATSAKATEGASMPVGKIDSENKISILILLTSKDCKVIFEKTSIDKLNISTDTEITNLSFIKTNWCYFDRHIYDTCIVWICDQIQQFSRFISTKLHKQSRQFT